LPPADSPTFVPGRVGVVGLGLMGGSFAKALHAGGTQVFAWNRTSATTELAMIETIDGELTDDVIGSCELIVLAGYPQACIEWLDAKQDLIRTPAPSSWTRWASSASYANAASPLPRGTTGPSWAAIPWRARSTYSGFAHSRATMFRGAPLVVVPPDMDDFAPRRRARNV